LVADWTAVTREAVMRARPFVTVLQFFKFTSTGRWPTLSEMRSHAYMAIVEGAQGLLWWSLGGNALRDVCTGWCDEKLGYLNNLKAVVGELADLEPVLLADDTPAALTANSQSATIHTKVKTVGAKGYVFAYNKSSSAVTATFNWRTAPSKVSVNAENRTLSPSGNQFSDTFGAYEAHVYIIDEPTVTVTFTSPTDGASVQGVVTVTAVATGGTPGYVYTLSADGTSFASGGSGSASWDTRTLSNGTHALAASVTDGSGAAATTNISVTVANPVPPAAPTSLTTMVASTSRVDLAWIDAANNEDGFKVERSTDGITFVQVGTVPANTVTYMDTTVVGGLTYTYRVRAFNAAGDSMYSNTATAVVAATAAPTTPTGLTAIVASASRVNLAWTDTSSNEDGFNIERSVNGSAFTQVATVPANSSGYDDAAVTTGNTYGYRIRAFNRGGTSAYSNTATASVTAPVAPSNLAATAATGPQVTLTWRDNSNNETTFEIFRAIGGGNNFTRLATVGANVTGFVDTTVVANTNYRYRVRAVNGVGSSSDSNTANVKLAR
jgi:fibronectin type 3 domain-containing protein